MLIFSKSEAIFFAVKICCQTDQNTLQKTLFDMLIILSELFIIALRSLM